MMFDVFPREIGFKKRFICRNKQDFLDAVNFHNGKKECFTSVYQCNDNGTYENATIDKIFFDFDGEGSFTSLLTFHTYLMQENIKHTVVCSGGGFHLYIICVNGDKLKSNKACLTNVHKYFDSLLTLNTDPAVIGDVSRLTRIINTYNVKRKKFCIPLTHDDLMQGLDYIKEKAEHQQPYGFVFYGAEPYNIAKHDGAIISNDIMIMDSSIQLQIDKDIFLQRLPPCVANMLLNEASNYRDRFMIITYLRESGYTKNEVLQILKKFLSPKKFHHCVVSEHQVDYLFKRTDLFPSCNLLKSLNKCPVRDICKQIKNLYVSF